MGRTYPLAPHTPDAETVAIREALLLPILDQNQRVGEYLKRRQSISDINPDTGEELEPDALGEPLDANTFPASPPSAQTTT